MSTTRDDELIAQVKEYCDDMKLRYDHEMSRDIDVPFLECYYVILPTDTNVFVIFVYPSAFSMQMLELYTWDFISEALRLMKNFEVETPDEFHLEVKGILSDIEKPIIWD